MKACTNPLEYAMHVVLNKNPGVAYDKNAYVALLEKGYALPIETRGNATVLLFKDVDDHIDGNGLSILWMLDGEGTFFHEGNAVPLKRGDAIVFDDKVEHGFESTDYCVAVNFDISLSHDSSPNFIAQTLDAFDQPQHAAALFSSPAPNF